MHLRTFLLLFSVPTHLWKSDHFNLNHVFTIKCVTSLTSFILNVSLSLQILPHHKQRDSAPQTPHEQQLILPGSPACSVPFLAPAALGCAASVSAWRQTRPLTFPAALPWWWSGAPAAWFPSSAPHSQYCSFPYLRTLNCPSPLRRPVLGPADPAINSCLCTTTLGPGSENKQEEGHDLKRWGGGGVN